MTIKNKNSKFSFLLGSGFSIPDKLPSVNELNKKLQAIDQNEIFIGSDQLAFFLNGQINPNDYERKDERLFLQEFLKFYNEKILKSGESFNYEKFYDFYSSYLNSKNNSETIESFYNIFTDKYINAKFNNRDCFNRISDFDRTFNQLIASLLQKDIYQGNATYLNYTKYGSFINFLKYLIEIADVKVHTLNHDLLFDFLGGYQSELCSYYSDGYEFEGSPFYGTISKRISEELNEEINKTYYVKLRRFTNKFNSRLSLFKLHGSIDNIIVYLPDSNTPISHIKRDFGISSYYFESFDKQINEFKFLQLYNEISPNFISGTTNKIRSYEKDPYYNNLLEHFKNNLINSEYLFIIGYGFADPGINKHIKDYFLCHKNRKIILIDPCVLDNDLIRNINHIHIRKGIQDVSFSELISSMSSNRTNPAH